MNLLFLSWSYLRERPLNTFLNTLILALGVSIIVILLLLSYQLKQNLEKNARGIDLVVGAKGSPMQMILSSIYHIDFPTGNIPLVEAQKIAANQRFVKNAIPLALGDSYRQFRIVGTNHSYMDVYGASLASGSLWQNDLEVTLGAQAAATLGLDVGDEFLGEHGLIEGGMAHDHHHYTIAGILSPNNSVVDNLIFTSVESVWLMHDKTDEISAPDTTTLQTDVFGIRSDPNDNSRELTSLLIQYRGPRAMLQFPRMVNSTSSLQAASPAYETARLFNIVGVGVDVAEGFAYIIILIAGLSIFIVLYNSLKDRKYDMAIIRSLGATRQRLLVLILLEGLIISFMGSGLGFILGHSTVEVIGRLMASSNQSLLTGSVFLLNEWLIAVISVVLGIFASAIPAIQAYKTDISNVLAKG